MMFELHEVDDLPNHVDHFSVSMVAKRVVVPSGGSAHEGRLFARL